LTVSDGLAHQLGMRTYSGNATAPVPASRSVTVPLNGYEVSWVRVTVAAPAPTFAVVVLGAYMVTASPRSAVACTRLSVKYDQPCP
jgi:hypothetical protein